MNELFEITREQVYLFISDVHLGGFNSKKNKNIEKDLISMIDYAESMDMEIVILGDLFDYWMEYPDYVPNIAPAVLKRFKLLHEDKPETLYINGNHDNWTERYLEDIGFDMEPEYRVLELNEKRILLMHGDGLINKIFDFPRPFFHRVIRNSYFVSFYKKILPKKIGIEFMRLYSIGNRKLKFWSNPGNHHLDSWATNWLKVGNTDAVICGHHHKPMFTTFDEKVYMNLGNYYEDRTVGIYANNSFYLATWDGTSKKFITRNTSHASY